jgi:hypothetical protein
MFTIFTFFLFAFSFTHATIRYVSKTGLSIPPYTSWETAADSIQECINISVFGDTIYVANGVYKERVNMIPGLTLLGSGMDSCLIDSREFNYVNGFYTIEVVDSCFLSDFRILVQDIDHGSGIVMKDGARVENCWIQEAYEGIAILAGTQFKPSAYKNIMLQVKNGITNVFAHSIIEENIIYAEEKGLVSQINSSPIYINNLIIFENVIGQMGFADYGGVISTLNNNLCYGRGAYGFSTYGNDTIKNNIVIGAGGNWGVGIIGAGFISENTHIENALTGLYYDVGGGSQPIFRYNNMWNNQTDFQNFTPDTTNIFSDPMFINPDSMNFHLQKYSPLIDAGDPNIMDVDSSRSDIGLYGGPYGESYIYLDLPPRPPINFTAQVDSSIITLSWNRNTEADFSHYNLYRDTIKNFTIDSTKLVASITDTFYLHFIPTNVESLYFKLTAVDNQGNESSPSEEISVLLVSVKGEWQTVNNYILYQNYPNPFNPSTKIGYRLKERGYVKLYIYSITGELVSVLVNQTQEAGYYEVEFNVGQDSSPVLASGIYIYQIMVRSIDSGLSENERGPSKPGPNGIPVFTDIKKMVYVK